MSSAVFCISLLAIGTIFFAYDKIIDRSYVLSKNMQQVIGISNPTLIKNITYDKSKNSYFLNQSVIGKKSKNSTNTETSHTVGNIDSQSLYSLQLPSDLSKGITTYDNTSNLSFSLVPEYSTMPARQDKGRIVYPIGLNGGKAVYSVIANGLQEDIAYNKAPSDSLTLKYKLKLPDTLQAKEISGGNIGIYSADSALFGNITFSTPADQKKVMDARRSSTKNSLVFVIPAPIIRTSNKSDNDKSKVAMTLNGDELVIKAERLKTINSAFSIDPSVIVATANSFLNQGNNDGSVVIDPSTNQVSEGGYASGLTGGLNSLTSLPATLYNHATVAYDGFIYVMGGNGIGTTTGGQIVLYNNIQSDGSLGPSWTKSTSSLPVAEIGGRANIYNGVIYIMLGDATPLTGNAANSELFYASVCTGSNTTTQYASNCTTKSTPGETSSWNTGTSLPLGVVNGSMNIYKGYIYQLAGQYTGYGCGTSVPVAPQGGWYSKINADGSNGSWIALGVLPAAVAAYGESVAYNNYMYMVDGNCSGYTGNVYYSHINADGSLGSWIAATSTKQGINTFGLFAYKGYLFTTAGITSGANSSNTETVNIRSDGSLGTWQYTTDVAKTYGEGGNMALYNGVLYAVGGMDNGGTSYANAYSQIILGGNRFNLNGFGRIAVATMPARSEMGVAAANGYIYMVGGFNNNSTPTGDCSANKICNGIFYAALGSNVGAWTQAGTLPTAMGNRRAPEVMINQGYIYVMGGLTDTSGNSECTSQFGTTVYYVCKDVWSTYVYFNNVGGCTGTSQCLSVTKTTSLPSGVAYGGYGIQNGYIYSFGGCTSGSIDTNGALKCTSPTASANYATVSYGSIGSWNSITSLPAAISNFGFTIYGGTIYVVGGENSSSVAQNSVYYAAICNGTNTTTIYTQNTATNCTSGSTPGTVSSWNSQTFQGWLLVAMPARFNASLVVFGGDLVLFNGSSSYGTTTASGDCSAAGQCNREWSTPIGSDGSITNNWYEGQSNASNMPSRSSASVAEYNGTVYVFGGYTNSTTASNDCTIAAVCGGYAFSANFGVGGNPSMQTWAQSTASYSNLSTGTAYSSSVAYNGYIYVIGGKTSTGTTGQVFYAAICTSSNVTTGFGTNCSASSTQGSISSWKTASALNSPRYSHKVVVYNGYLYAIGGTSTGSNYLNTTEYSKINSDGSINTWNSSSNNLQTGRSGLTSVQYNGYIYAIGGTNGSLQSSVEYSKIDSSNGSIGAWAYTSALPVAITNSASVVYNGYIYEVAGSGAGGSTNNVYYSKINSTGTINPWVQTTSILSELPRQLEGAYAVNGYLYVYGGLFDFTVGGLDCAGGNSSGGLSSGIPSNKACSATSYAPIFNGGFIGNWQGTTYFPGSGPIMAPRYGFSTAYNNGFIYIIGGDNNNTVASNDCQTTTYCSGVFFNEFNTQPKIGNYTQLVDLSSSSNIDPAPYKITSNGGTCFVDDACPTSTSNSLPNPGNGDSIGSGGTGVSYSSASTLCTIFSNNASINYVNNIWGNYYGLSFNSSGCSSPNNPKGNGRYLELQYTLDDSYSVVFGSGCTSSSCFVNGREFAAALANNSSSYLIGNVTSLTNYSLFYHAANNSRLRGGSTFNNGSIQALDTPI